MTEIQLVFNVLLSPSLRGGDEGEGEKEPFYHPHPNPPPSKGEGITCCYGYKFSYPLCPAPDLWDTISLLKGVHEDDQF